MIGAADVSWSRLAGSPDASAAAGRIRLKQETAMVCSVSIRLARLCERSMLEALQLRASLMNEADRESLLAHPDAVELPLSQIEAGRVFVAEGDGLVLGFSVVLPREDGDAELDGLFVEPARWRNGIGRSLVDVAADLAKAEGASALHVVGNWHSVGFYQACGFELLGETRTRFSTAALMRKHLASPTMRKPAPGEH